MQPGGDNSPNAKNVEIYSATPGVYNVSTGEVLKKAKVYLREATKVNSDDDDDQDSL